MRRARTASGGSEEAARDTSRPRTDDLEDGVPLPLLKHGIEVLRALATAAASTAERRVARKDINSKPPHGSWQALFDASKPSSLVARGYAAKGYGAGPDYGRYWITAAGLEYLAAVDAPPSPTPTPLSLPRRCASTPSRIWTRMMPLPLSLPLRRATSTPGAAARLSKELGTAALGLVGARVNGRIHEQLPRGSSRGARACPLRQREPLRRRRRRPLVGDFDSEGSDDDDDSDDDDSGGNSRTGLSAAFAAVDGRLVVLSEAENAKTVAACDG
ncbi:hypothetical protein SO694_00021217 [Aureococcus anophagefferens]|uniref:Uncharacterized protein n=1 Tax=Aureococcus anophagefferens TaxID=44056 RepID=A0ABR1FUI6_AURAN